MDLETTPRPETNDPQADAARHRAVVRRVLRWQIVFAAFGLVLWAALGGARMAAGFAVGAAASLASFGLLDRLSAAVGGGPVSASGVALSAVRILLVGGVLFAIMRTYSLPPMALGTGILITVAAITMEAVTNRPHA